MSLLARSFGKASLVLALPLAELLFLRWYLHSALNLRFGFTNTTDFDFLLPGPTAYFILMYLLERAEPMRLRANYGFLTVSAVSFLSFVVLNQNFEALSAAGPVVFTAAWFGTLMLTVATAFCGFLRPSYFITSPNRYAFLPCTLIAFSMVLYMNYVQGPWVEFGAVTSNTLHYFFERLAGHGVVASFTDEGVLKISHAQLVLRIGKGCGGMDSLFFFSMLFAIYYTLHRAVHEWYQWLPMYLFGMIGIYFLNVFRIIILFFSGIWLRSQLGMELGTEIFKALFHTHLGWLMYSLATLAYFRCLGLFSELSLQKLNRAQKFPATPVFTRD